MLVKGVMKNIVSFLLNHGQRGLRTPTSPLPLRWRSVRVMYLIHRNRVAFSGRLRCGPPSPAGQGFAAIALADKY